MTIAPCRVCLVQFLPEEAMLCTVWLHCVVVLCGCTVQNDLLSEILKSKIAPYRVCLVQFLPEEAMRCTVWNMCHLYGI